MGEVMVTIDFKVAMGTLSVLIATTAYAIMLWGIFRQHKHPSPVSWIGFGLCTGVGFFVQVWGGADAGSWVMGWTALCCIIVAAASWITGGIEFTRLDQITFGLGVATFIAWLVCYFGNYDQTLAAVLATLSDLFLYGPSIRNGWLRPEKENPSGYALNSVKFGPSLLALPVFSLATVLYAVSLMVANALMNIMLLARTEWLRGNVWVHTRSRKLLDAGLPVTLAVLFAAEYGFTYHVGIMSDARLGGLLVVTMVITITGWCFICGTRDRYLHDKQILSARVLEESGEIHAADYADQILSTATMWGAVTGAALTYQMDWQTEALVGRIILAVIIPPGFILLFTMGKVAPHWRWLPQKLLFPWAILLGIYADMRWGWTVGAGVYFGLTWLQLVWTIKTWPHQQVGVDPRQALQDPYELFFPSKAGEVMAMAGVHPKYSK